jgi:hypothetical protein
MPADPIPSSPEPVPDVLPKPAPLGAPEPSAGLPRRRRRRLSWLARLLSRRRYEDEIAVYRHSSLFYWWPVWALGYILFLVSYFENRHLEIVPHGTEAAQARKVEIITDQGRVEEERDVLILPKGKRLPTAKTEDGQEYVPQPKIYIAAQRWLGTIYVIVLLFVIVMTNITMRGLWSVLVLMSLVLLAIILYLSNAWGVIFRGVGQLSVYINMGGYFVISTVLLAFWVVNFFFLDRMTYMVFMPGQLRVRTEIGGAEMVYDTTNMTVQKQRTDLFRHWVLGFGSGDLLVYPATIGHALELPNVMRVGTVVRKIDRLIKEQVVVAPEDRDG